MWLPAFKMIRHSLAATVIVVCAAAPADAAESVTLRECGISLEEEVQVPAQEPGVIKEMPVRDGQPVKKGDLLVQIDDLIPQRQYDVAKNKLEAAKAEAESDVGVRYAAAAAATAKAEYEVSVAANRKAPGAVTDVRLRELALKHDEMVLTIEKSEKDRYVAACQAKVAEAEMKAAEANREHRHITAVLDGMVVEMSRHVGEWVQAGDPLMRLVRLDRLYVEGLGDPGACHPAELQGRPVTVTVELARKQRVTVPGKVVFVNPLIEGGKFQVRAEVENRKENGFWLLLPGLRADMDIHLK